jgi:glycosyltransferase involved in cell wall biosynthesis
VRLLYLNHNYRYGGTYYRAMPLAQQLAQRGHQVTLLTVSSTRSLRVEWSEVNGVHLGETPHWGQSFSGEGYGLVDVAWRMLQPLRRHYDIIHMFDHKPNATFPGLPGRWRGARLVADWADWWGGPGGINDVPHRFACVARFEEWWEEASKRWADGVVTISRVLEQRALSLGCRPERVLFLPTGAALQRIHPIPLAVARESLGIPLGRRLIGFIGMGQGDLQIVMRALQKLPDVWLMVVGRASTRTNDLARAFGVAERCWQTGFVPDERVAGYLACAEVMVLPLMASAANRGRLPNKLLDYMAAGRPTVANPVGETEIILRAHPVGLLTEGEDMTAAIQTLLDDETRREALGRTARAVAESVYAWPRLVDRLEAFYERLLTAQ